MHAAILYLLIFTFPVPVIDPVPTERFPEYVRDMLYGEENKLKTEFSVSVPYCLYSFYLILQSIHTLLMCVCSVCNACLCFAYMVCSVMIVTCCVYIHRSWQSCLSHPLLWQSYLTTSHTTDSTTSIPVSFHD